MNTTVQLHDPDIYPTEEILKTILCNTYRVYQSLLDLFAANHLCYEWRFYHDVNYWLCKVQFKKRTIVWMSVMDGYIQATIYFSEKYINDIYGLQISNEIIESIKNTKNTGKSKPCIFKMTTMKIMNDFDNVLQFKLIAK